MSNGEAARTDAERSRRGLRVLAAAVTAVTGLTFLWLAEQATSAAARDDYRAVAIAFLALALLFSVGPRTRLWLAAGMCALVLATMLYLVTGVFFESAPIWVRALVGLFGVMLGGGGIAAAIVQERRERR